MTDRQSQQRSASVQQAADMQQNPVAQYQSLMCTLRRRLDLVAALKSVNADVFSKAESAAFQGRKVVEGIAFGCLVAAENGLRSVPGNARGQWNADRILSRLQAKRIDIFPNPSALRVPTEDERATHSVALVIEGLPERAMTHDGLRAIYARLHKWLHEINPYIEADRETFVSRYEAILWGDLSKLRLLVERHFIAIGGRGFYCTLWDSQDGSTKVLPLNK